MRSKYEVWHNLVGTSVNEKYNVCYVQIDATLFPGNSPILLKQINCITSLHHTSTLMVL